MTKIENTKKAGKNDIIQVYSAGKMYEAKLIAGLLSNNDIEAIVVNKQDGQYFFGEVEIYVVTKDAEKAKEIIDNREE
jgi:hypothetical protein